MNGLLLLLAVHSLCIFALSQDCGVSAEVLISDVAKYSKEISTKKPTEDILIKRGNAYLNLGRTAEAKLDAENALKLNPNSADALYLLGHIYDNLASYGWANLYYSKAIVLKPDSATMHYARGRVRTFRNESLAAIKDYRRAIELDAESIDAYFGIGIELRKRGERVKAIESFQYGLSVSIGMMAEMPTGPCLSDFLVSRSNLFRAMKMNSEALDDLNNAIVQNSQNEQALYYRAAYFATIAKDYTKAAADLTNAIKLDPEYAEAYKDRADAYRKLKLDDLANADSEKYRTLSNTEPAKLGSR